MNTLTAPAIKSVELPSGIRLPYAEQGDPAGIPMVMLHGVTDSWRSFEPVLPYLPESVHAFSLTQRGHGDADRPATGYRLRDFTADVAAFMDAGGIEAAVIVGHSMGSYVGQGFALRYPERTLGLVTAGSFVSFRANPGIVEFAEYLSGLTDPVDDAVAREFQESTLARPIPPALLEMFVQESLKVPARIWKDVFAGFLKDDTAGDLSQIQAPTLVLWGDQDAFCPRVDQDTILATIPDVRLKVYAGGGHAIHWEEPERFAADITAFSEAIAR